jgi:DNA repair ATPase RecN
MVETRRSGKRMGTPPRLTSSPKRGKGSKKSTTSDAPDSDATKPLTASVHHSTNKKKDASEVKKSRHEQLEQIMRTIALLQAHIEELKQFLEGSKAHMEELKQFEGWHEQLGQIMRTIALLQAHIEELKQLLEGSKAHIEELKQFEGSKKSTTSDAPDLDATKPLTASVQREQDECRKLYCEERKKDANKVKKSRHEQIEQIMMNIAPSSSRCQRIEKIA